MKNGYPVMDADIHVMEPADLYQKFMDPKWGDRIPRGSGERVSTGMYVYTDAGGTMVRTPPPEASTGRMTYLGARSYEPDPRFADAQARDYDPSCMVEAFDVEGIDLGVIFRTNPLFADESQEPEYAFAIARAWNDYAADYASYAPDRIKVAGQVPLHDPEMAAAEARRCVGDLGHVGLCVLPEPINGRAIFHQDFDVLWDTIQETGAPVCFHATSSPNQPAVGNRFIHPHGGGLEGTMAQPIENQLAVASIIYTGVLERFPGLRVAFLEGNCAWLPWLLYRLDERYGLVKSAGARYAGPRVHATLSLKPSEYFARQGFISMDADEYLGADVIDRLGDDLLLFSSDWPHGDAPFPHATEKVLAMEGVSDASKRKILWDNPRRLYGMA